jgi:hypothetical protein
MKECHELVAILAGCTRIYLVDKSKKGSDVEIISDSNFF